MRVTRSQLKRLRSGQNLYFWKELEFDLKNWYSDRWNDGVTSWNACLDTAVCGKIYRSWAVQNPLKSAEICPNRQQCAVESIPAVGYADDTPEVYKIPMVRMSKWLTNVRKYGSIAWCGRNVTVVNLRRAWGLVKMYVMKSLEVLQVLPSAQAYRASLREYEQIGISERGKVGTLSVCTQWSGSHEKSVNETSDFYFDWERRHDRWNSDNKLWRNSRQSFTDKYSKEAIYQRFE